MDIKQYAIHEYLHEGKGYGTLAKKYGVSRTTLLRHSISNRQ